jgi:F-type H+-transporting ATPase subunit gamma
MSQAREIKRRTKSISEIKKITRAMKLISAAKLKKARHQLEQVLPFFDAVRSTIADIMYHTKDIESKYFEDEAKKDSERTGYLIVTGDKGLSGGYNHNIIKMAEKSIELKDKATIFPVGSVGANYFSRKGYNVVHDFDWNPQNPTVTEAREIAQVLLKKYENNEIDNVYMIYTEMVTAMNLVPRVVKLLPLDREEMRKVYPVDNPDETLIYEPSPEAVLDILIPK